ncbi:MAG: FAD-binding oxidoreductase [Candidatus Thorarchaeota archaeon]
MNIIEIEKKSNIGIEQNFTEEVERFISPEHISTDTYEIEAIAGDLSLISKYHYKFKEQHQASHVIRPANTEELSKLMKICYKYSIPVTIRAAGTSCYSSSTPTKGGVIIDMRRMSAIHNIDPDNMIVRCDAGISWLKLIEGLLDYGLAPKCYPTSYKSSCVGGFVVTSGKAGIGVLKSGSIKDVLLSVILIKPDGSSEKLTRDSKGEISIDDIVGSFGIFGAVAEVELEITNLKTSMEFIGYGFKSIKNATAFFLALKSNIYKPFFLSISDKKFEKFAHTTYPARDFSVFAVYYDDKRETSEGIAFAKETALKYEGLDIDEWYLKEKWRDIADTEVNLGRWCQNLIFQEYWVSDNTLENFYVNYANVSNKFNYKKAFYAISGPIGGNRIKLFGLSDINNSREFFGIKSIFHEMTRNIYKQNDSLYTLGVVNTFYFLKFNPKKAFQLKSLKNRLDPKDLVNSYRLVKAKMKSWRIALLFYIARFLYRVG